MKSGENKPADGDSVEQLHWQAALAADIDGHFAAAQRRAEQCYRREFRSLKAVLRRHWRCRADIPADVLALPRSLWRLWQRLLGKPVVQRPLTHKEAYLAELMRVEVLQLDTLQLLFLKHLQAHPEYRQHDAEQWLQALADQQPEQLEQRLHQTVARWGLSHDSSRDLLLFVGLGLLGRSLSDKILFGSASLVGISLVSSVYLSQQNWLLAQWFGWLGVPMRVKVVGVVTGFVGVLLLTPLLAPFLEWGFNRLWSRRRFHRMVEQVHRQLRPSLQEKFWAYGSYLQFVPDVLLLLRQLR